MGLLYFITLRLIHIVASVFWAGGAFIFVLFIEPTAKATAPAGMDFLHHMVGRKGYNALMKITSTVTVVSGVLLVWENAAGNWLAWMGMGPGVVFSVGSVIGVMAYLLGMFLVNPRADRLVALGREMEAAEGPPSEIQHGELKRIAGEISVLGRAYFLLIALSLAMMAVARYWLF